MEEMTVNLFEYLLEYIKFFAHPDMQKLVWANRNPWEEGTCEDWVFDALREWCYIKKSLCLTSPRLAALVKEIDELQKILAVFLKKIPEFKESRMYQLHLKIMADREWRKIQEQSAIIFQKAQAILDL